MCGIAGYYSTSNFFNKEDLKIMTYAIAHRGPNAEGFFTEKNCGLGHRRLSIIDLSAEANQPMISANGRYVIIYNGEVYNYSEIANELRLKKSTTFKTSSDTEVILEAFNHFGHQFIHRLNGMFAFAIYDREKDELFLYRDRIGIKPLFYFWDGKNLAFTSELKSLMNLSKIPKELNKESIKAFLNTGYIPAPSSIFNKIKKLEPGSFLKVSANGIEHQTYWTLNSAVTDEIIVDEKKALVKTTDLLMSSVQYQLKSDVPFGVFLSGGIDSSIITALAVNLSSVKINTFSIGFKENQYNEALYSKAIAKYLKTEHHEFIVSYKDAIELIERYFDAYDEPFADSSGIPTMLVSKLAKQHVTVALSGDGGDELFLGYGFYQWAKRLNNPFIKLLRSPIAYSLSQLSNRYQRAARLFEYSDINRLKSHIFSQEQYFFSETELDHLLHPDYLTSSTQFNKYYTFSSNKFSNRKRKLNPMESQAFFDMHYYLPDDLLKKVDRASMQYSLETRVPFLDHRIIEFVLNIDPAFKYKWGQSKVLLKEILYQYIPEEYFNRPKRGFSIPLQDWLKTDLKYLIDQYLSKETIERFGIVHYHPVERLKADFFAGKNYLYNRLWILIVLHKWLIKNSDSISL